MHYLLEPEITEFIKGHLHDDPFSLSLKLKNSGMEHYRQVVLQIQARQKALKKLPELATNFELIFPEPISVEQASSAATARFKSGLFQGENFVDLTGGMGVDALFFADRFKNGAYVEKDPGLCEIADHNFAALCKSNIKVLNASAEEFIQKNEVVFDLVYLDPSRRDGNRQKVFKISDCQPDVLKLENQLVKQAQQVLVKLSPLADIQNTFSSFQHLRKIWVVSHKNECKELLCLLSKNGSDDLEIETVNILADAEKEIFSFRWHEEKETSASFEMPMQYVYEPNVSILKAGAFKLAGKRFALSKLHPHTHLYTSDYQVDFPGRIFFVKDVLKIDRREVDRAFSGRGVNVICRNFYMKPEELTKKFRLKSGDDAYLIATTLADGSNVFLVCSRLK